MRGITLEWLGYTVARLNWSLLRGALQERCCLPADAEALTRAAYRRLSMAGMTSGEVLHVTDLREWAYEGSAAWYQAPSLAQQRNAHLNRFVCEVLKLYLEAVQWDVAFATLKQRARSGGFVLKGDGEVEEKYGPE